MKTPRQYAEEVVASLVRSCGVLCREELTVAVEEKIAEAMEAAEEGMGCTWCAPPQSDSGVA